MAKREMQPIEEEVRQRIKALRKERGMTLAEVASRANLDTSALSRLENGKRKVSLDHLPGLAHALGVDTNTLLGVDRNRDPRVRGAARKMAGLTMWPLSATDSGSGLNVFKIHISASRNTPPRELPVHTGQDWIYVVGGKLRLMLGEDDFVIGPGEAIEFSTLTPHWFGAIDGPVELIGIFGPQGERIHLHD